MLNRAHDAKRDICDSHTAVSESIEGSRTQGAVVVESALESALRRIMSHIFFKLGKAIADVRSTLKGDNDGSFREVAQC